MIVEILVVGAGAFLIGTGLSYFILKNFKLVEKREAKKLNKILSDPELLKQKLDSAGKFRDRTGIENNEEAISYEVVQDATGKKEIKEIRTPVKPTTNIIERIDQTVPRSISRPVEYTSAPVVKKVKPKKKPNHTHVSADLISPKKPKMKESRKSLVPISSPSSKVSKETIEEIAEVLADSFEENNLS